MAFLNEADKQRIAQAISAAEDRTSGEIVAVVARASDDYYYIPLLWAALAALTVPLALISLTGLGAEQIFTAQLVTFLASALILQINAIKWLVIPTGVKRRRAHGRAVDQFLAQNLHTTKGRTGVLIFVSIAEHYAEVIADEGIYEKVDASVWREAVDTLTGHICRRETAEGFIAAIGLVGGVLAEHFPPGVHDHDELPNHLVEL